MGVINRTRDKKEVTIATEVPKEEVKTQPALEQSNIEGGAKSDKSAGPSTPLEDTGVSIAEVQMQPSNEDEKSKESTKKSVNLMTKAEDERSAALCEDVVKMEPVREQPIIENIAIETETVNVQKTQASHATSSETLQSQGKEVNKIADSAENVIEYITEKVIDVEAMAAKSVEAKVESIDSFPGRENNLSVSEIIPEESTSDMKIEVEIPVSKEDNMSDNKQIKFEVEVLITEVDNGERVKGTKDEDEVIASLSEKTTETNSMEPLTIVEVNETEAMKITKHSNEPVVLEKSSEKEVRHKKQSRQESVVDSESLPDIEELDAKDNIFLTEENKDLLSTEDQFNDDDDDFEKFKRERSNSRSSYEETLAGMDPEILKELGLEESPGNNENGKEAVEMDLSQIPDETAEERMKRIEEKASGIVIEEDLVPRKSRSRSRSRSKSRPPNLDTVKEQKKEEIMEAAKFYGILPSLDTIKESPSTASMLGMLQGGMSSASLNTVLQECHPAASILSHPQSPTAKEAPADIEGIESKDNSMLRGTAVDNNISLENQQQQEGNQSNNESILQSKGKDSELCNNTKNDISGDAKLKKKKAKRSDTMELISQESEDAAQKAAELTTAQEVANETASLKQQVVEASVKLPEEAPIMSKQADETTSTQQAKEAVETAAMIKKTD